MKGRINKGRIAFTKSNKIWKSKQVNRKTKLKLYKTTVRPVLLNGCETWKMNRSDEKKLDSFQYQCLKKIMQIFWPNIISTDELNEVTQVKKISLEVKRRRWNWLGHVLRKVKGHYWMAALTWQPECRRRVGRPKTTWRRTLEKERKEFRWRTWHEAWLQPRDRMIWRKSVEVLCASRHEEDK
ncbi:hypothetical protein HOLleu_03917 [Holothuria leucospilota]|uniref:Endonuclease-reverse transcriptase n=1 Tax=Holothuria leucospilota TaxID=206669 RepID=A0A9Q1CT70_HOLLE|nr:hypothetical protein HOLleu_03917 [Holothuria leucospilota]